MARRSPFSVTPTSTAVPSGAAGGDLAGTYPNPDVQQMTPASGNLSFKAPTTANYFSWYFTGWTGTDEKVRLSLATNDSYIDNMQGGNFWLRNTNAGAVLGLSQTGSAGHIQITNTGTGGDIAFSSTGTGNSITFFTSGTNAFMYLASNSGQLMDVNGVIVKQWGAETISVIGTANFASDANLTAAATTYRFEIINITGTQTNRSLIMPTTSGAMHFFKNNSSSTVTIKTVAGTGFDIAAARGAWGHCDGTNYVRMTADSVAT